MELKEDSEYSQKIEEIIKGLNVAFVVVDSNKQIVYATVYARKKLFHNKPEFFYGRDVRTFHNKHARKKISHLYRKAKKGRFDELPFIKLIDEDKKTIMYLVKTGALLDSSGNFAGFVLAFFDVTSFTISRSSQLIKKIPVHTEDLSTVLLDVKEIAYMNAEDNKTLIIDKNGNKYSTNLSLKELESRLNLEGFFRTHRCCITSLTYIREVKKDKKGSYYAKLSVKNSPLIPISRRQYYKLKKLFPFGFR